MQKIAKHPNGMHITFNDGPHTYIDTTGMRYTSGTQFLKKFTPQFDAVAVSKKCSEGDNPKYAGKSPVDIRNEWKIEGERGRNEGTNLHEYVENLLLGRSGPEPISERCEQLFVRGKKAVDKLLARFTFIAAEMIIFSPDLKIAGMIDLLLHDLSTCQYIIADWKQNKEISADNTFQNLLPPADHLSQTDINQYSLQLSLYQHILDRESYFQGNLGFRRALIHLTPETNKAIPLDDYSYEIVEMLKYDKRI